MCEGCKERERERGKRGGRKVNEVEDESVGIA